MLAMLHTRHDLSLGCAVAGQFVRDHHPWNGPLLFEQLAQQALSPDFSPGGGASGL
jgi:hypothetical protein